MKNNILRNLETYIAQKEAQGGVVSEEIKNYVKFKKLCSEEESNDSFLYDVFSWEFDTFEQLTINAYINGVSEEHYDSGL
jgi:carbamoylphosphate synthase large subunit